MKQLASIFFLILISLFVGKGSYYLKDGFTMRRIHSLSYHVEHVFHDEVYEALAQPFFYLGRGRQCFAFESRDGRHVLKLPRTDIYKTPFWMRVLPLNALRKHLEQKHQVSATFIVESIRLAQEELGFQTGIIASHLGQSAPSPIRLHLVDALSCHYHPLLYKTPFILQKKQPLLIPIFLNALKQNHLEESKKILEALLDVIVKRAKKGILNRDRSFLRNYGFDGTYAYQIDVGSFFQTKEMTPEMIYQKSVRDSTDPIREWLAQINPQMRITFDQLLQE